MIHTNTVLRIDTVEQNRVNLLTELENVVAEYGSISVEILPARQALNTWGPNVVRARVSILPSKVTAITTYIGVINDVHSLLSSIKRYYLPQDVHTEYISSYYSIGIELNDSEVTVPTQPRVADVILKLITGDTWVNPSLAITIQRILAEVGSITLRIDLLAE